MIELYKMVKGIYDPACIPHFEFVELSDDLIRTRGNRYKLIQHHCSYDLRKYSYTNRVISVWNSLSDHVVSSNTVSTFKHRLDRYWCDQDVLYNYKADLHSIGSRSLLV